MDAHGKTAAEHHCERGGTQGWDSHRLQRSGGGHANKSRIRKTMGILKTMKRFLTTSKDKDNIGASHHDRQDEDFSKEHQPQLGSPGYQGDNVYAHSAGAGMLADDLRWQKAAGKTEAAHPGAVGSFDLLKSAPGNVQQPLPPLGTPPTVASSSSKRGVFALPAVERGNDLMLPTSDMPDAYMTDSTGMTDGSAESNYLLCTAPVTMDNGSPHALPEDRLALTSSTTLMSSHVRHSPNGFQAAKAAFIQQQRLNPTSCPPITTRVSEAISSPSGSPCVIPCRSAATPGLVDLPTAAISPLAQARSYEPEYMSPSSTANRRHPATSLQTMHSARLSSCPSGPMSPGLNRGSMSNSMTLRRHISLKGLLNLGTYDFVPDVDVSQAQQEADSSDDEEFNEGISTAQTSSLGYAGMASLPPLCGLDLALLERASQRSSAAGIAMAAAQAAQAAAAGSPEACAVHLARAASLRLGPGSHVSPKAGPTTPGSAFATRSGQMTPHGSAFASNDSMGMDEDASQGHTGGQASKELAAGSSGTLNSQASVATGEHPMAQLRGSASVNSEAGMYDMLGRRNWSHAGLGVSMTLQLEELLQHSSTIMHDVFREKESNILAVNPAMPRAMKRSMWSISHFNLSKCLHKGYASHVYAADCKTTGYKVVLKVYRLSAQCDLQRVQLYREICVHSKLQHQNIAQFYAAFLEDNCVVIVQEFAAGGDLLRYMYKSGGRLPERQAVQMVLQPFLAALQYLHTQGIIHRDIKPENCLLNEDNVLKLADFGLAVDLKAERANTRAGTLDYMAPEVLRCPTKETPDQFKSTPGAAHYEMGADAWAVGVFAYELVVGGPPFKADQMIDTARNIMGGRVQFPEGLSEGACGFISACLRKHPGDRPTVLEMLRMPWITTYQRRQSVMIPALAAGQMSPSTRNLGGVMRKASQDLRAMASGPHAPGLHAATHLGTMHPAMQQGGLHAMHGKPVHLDSPSHPCMIPVGHGTHAKGTQGTHLDSPVHQGAHLPVLMVPPPATYSRGDPAHSPLQYMS